MQKNSIFKTTDGKDYTFIFALVSTLFLLWGFAHALLDVLNKHFQNTLHVTKAESGLVQSAVYGGYFLMAIPAGWIARAYGYQRGILVGLTLFAAGAFWFYPATRIGEWSGLLSWVQGSFHLTPDAALQMTSFGAFLLGLFVIALGLTCLETVANPYTTVLGPVDSAASRINLAQTFNALGWILGPLIGGMMIFPSQGSAENGNASLALPYGALGAVVTLMAVFFSRVKLPDLQPDAASDHLAVHPDASGSRKPLRQRPHFLLAVAAQFFYVAAQTGVNSFFINYIVENVAGWNERKASLLLGFGGMGLFMVGRFLGSFVLRRFDPDRVLALFALINVGLMAVVMAGWGHLSALALVACYFFMSTMFPTIFSLGLRGLGADTKRAASPIVMAIVGGAVAPVLMGAIADGSSMRIGFLVPLACFAAIFLYAWGWRALYAKSA